MKCIHSVFEVVKDSRFRIFESVFQVPKLKLSQNCVSAHAIFQGWVQGSVRLAPSAHLHLTDG